jgi:DNA-binding MarR family transcriptional regulator
MVGDTCLCLHVQRAARTLARRFDEAFRPLGLTHGQFSMLMSLNRPGPASIGRMAQVLAMDRTTLTANLKPLERRRLLTIAIDPDDRRGRLVQITEAGRALLVEALPIWKREHRAIDRLLQHSSPVRLRADLGALA